MTNILTNFLVNLQNKPEQNLFSIVARNIHSYLSFKDIADGAYKYANLLKATGAQAGDVVLISLALEPDLVFAFFGALFAGCIPSMMPMPSVKQDPVLFWSSHDKLFKHISGGFFITSGGNVEQVKSNIEPGLMTILTPGQATDSTKITQIYDWAAEEICALQHSSGTTGLKKGVTLTSRAILEQVSSYTRALGLEQQDTIVSWLPLYHDMGFVATFLTPLVTGNLSIIMSPFEWLITPLELFRLIEHHNGKFVWLPNFAFAHLARSVRESDSADLSGVKAFINCSEPCKAETFDAFLAAFDRFGVRREQLQVCYAMAETVFAVTQTQPGKVVRRIRVSQASLRSDRRVVLGCDDPITLLSNGWPVDGMEVRISGDDEVGEIGLKGRFVFGGYHKIDSAACFNEDGYYLTGDLGFLHDGELYVLGRTKDMIIVLGKNFFANEIEAIVNTVAGVKPGRAVAIGVYNEEVGSEDAIVIAELDGSVDKKAVRTDLKLKLESTIGLVPKKVVFVDPNWLVKSTSGKISRSENITKYLKEFVHDL